VVSAWLVAGITTPLPNAVATQAARTAKRRLPLIPLTGTTLGQEQASHIAHIRYLRPGCQTDPVAERVVKGDGVIEWRDDDGRLHRQGGPARVSPSGREEWFRHGNLHRADGPAVVHANGSEKWYRDGRRHREGAPACVYVNGTEKWYRDGKRHRDDGPAAIYPDGRRIWFVNGVKVREERVAPSTS
jgi:hypothetical protein